MEESRFEGFRERIRESIAKTPSYISYKTLLSYNRLVKDDFYFLFLLWRRNVAAYDSLIVVHTLSKSLDAGEGRILPPSPEQLVCVTLYEWLKLKAYRRFVYQNTGTYWSLSELEAPTFATQHPSGKLLYHDGATSEFPSSIFSSNKATEISPGATPGLGTGLSSITPGSSSRNTPAALDRPSSPAADSSEIFSDLIKLWNVSFPKHQPGTSFTENGLPLTFGLIENYLEAVDGYWVLHILESFHEDDREPIWDPYSCLAPAIPAELSALPLIRSLHEPEGRSDLGHEVRRKEEPRTESSTDAIGRDAERDRIGRDSVGIESIGREGGEAFSASTIGGIRLTEDQAHFLREYQGICHQKVVSLKERGFWSRLCGCFDVSLQSIESRDWETVLLETLNSIIVNERLIDSGYPPTHAGAGLSDHRTEQMSLIETMISNFHSDPALDVLISSLPQILHLSNDEMEVSILSKVVHWMLRSGSQGISGFYELVSHIIKLGQSFAGQTVDGQVSHGRPSEDAENHPEGCPIPLLEVLGAILVAEVEAAEICKQMDANAVIDQVTEEDQEKQKSITVNLVKMLSESLARKKRRSIQWDQRAADHRDQRSADHRDQRSADQRAAEWRNKSHGEIRRSSGSSDNEPRDIELHLSGTDRTKLVGLGSYELIIRMLEVLLPSQVLLQENLSPGRKQMSSMAVRVYCLSDILQSEVLMEGKDGWLSPRRWLDEKMTGGSLRKLLKKIIERFPELLVQILETLSHNTLSKTRQLIDELDLYAQEYSPTDENSGDLHKLALIQMTLILSNIKLLGSITDVLPPIIPAIPTQLNTWIFDSFKAIGKNDRSDCPIDGSVYLLSKLLSCASALTLVGDLLEAFYFERLEEGTVDVDHVTSTNAIWGLSARREGRQSERLAHDRLPSKATWYEWNVPKLGVFVKLGADGLPMSLKMKCTKILSRLIFRELAAPLISIISQYFAQAEALAAVGLNSIRLIRPTDKKRNRTAPGFEVGTAVLKRSYEHVQFPEVMSAALAHETYRTFSDCDTSFFKMYHQFLETIKEDLVIGIDAGKPFLLSLTPLRQMDHVLQRQNIHAFLHKFGHSLCQTRPTTNAPKLVFDELSNFINNILTPKLRCLIFPLPCENELACRGEHKSTDADDFSAAKTGLLLTFGAIPIPVMVQVLKNLGAEQDQSQFNYLRDIPILELRRRLCSLLRVEVAGVLAEPARMALLAENRQNALQMCEDLALKFDALFDEVLGPTIN